MEPVGGRGARGWTPVFANVNDDPRTVTKIVDWVGGKLPKPELYFLGTEGPVATAAEAREISGRGINHLEYGADASLIVHYTDGSTEVRESYFSPLLALAEQVNTQHGEVNADATAVEMSRAQVEGYAIQVGTQHTEVDLDATAVEISRVQVVGLAETVATQHDQVNTKSGQMEQARSQMVTLAADVNNKHIDVGNFTTAVELSRQQVVNNAAQVVLDKNTTRGYRDETELKRNEISLNASQVAADKTAIATYLALAWYGIEWDTATATSACARIGSTELQKILPVQSLMRGCLLLDDGQVNYYLHSNDWSLKANGFASKLDGTDGQVMVEIPQHYRRFEVEGTKRRVKISEIALAGFTKVPKVYVSAYEATVQRSTSKLASVVNITPDYRGGNDNAAFDNETRTFLGRPASDLGRHQFRAFARNRAAGFKWNCDLYETEKTVSWLYFTEYADFNCQLAFNPALTPQGYRQGGLGDGVTNVAAGLLNSWTSYRPFVPCGHSNSLGNRTGNVGYVMPPEYGAALTVQVPRYRGLEHLFGHLYKWLDGANVKVQADNAGGQSQLFVATDPELFSDTGYAGYELRGLVSRTSGYIQEITFGDFGEITPSNAGLAGTSSTVHKCDYFFGSFIPANSDVMRAIQSGLHSYSNAQAGILAANIQDAPTAVSSRIGTRLTYLP